MPCANWIRRVSGALRHLGKEFEENELAYLALTSKAEREIVGRLAFWLHRRFANDSVAVAREFTIRRGIKRVDLAIVDEGVPRLLLEAKAIHAFAAYRPPEQCRYPSAVRKDVNKLRAYQPDNNDDLQKVVLLLVTYHHRPPDPRWDGVVGYAAQARGYPAPSLRDLANELGNHLPDQEFPLSASGNVPAGHAFGIGVTIHYRLFGPY